MSSSLVVTIDTEPDNQWIMPSAGAPAADLRFANTRGLGRLIEALRRLGAPATWLTTYSVARDPESVRVLRAAAAGGDEIGGHLHAWETPPLTPADATAHPYIYEYDETIRMAKLRHVTEALVDAFGTRPISYRAGRWGIDRAEYLNLAACGYRIDTSVVPGHDFGSSRGLARGGPDFRGALASGPAQPRVVEGLWEVPASVAVTGALSTAGAGAAAWIARRLGHRPDLPSRGARKLLDLSGACRMVWVRPLMHRRDRMVEAALSLARRGAQVINVMFHSSEAFEGTSPRSRTRADVDRFHADLAAIVEALTSRGLATPRTLRDAVAHLPGGPAVEASP